MAGTGIVRFLAPAARRLWPLALFGGAFALFFISGGADYISLDTFRTRHAELARVVAMHYVPAVAAFMALYVLVASLSIPGASVLTLAGGFLFGAAAATAYVVVSATTGAILVFLAARTVFGKPLRARAGPWLAWLEEGFRQDAWSYMLMLRLIPLFPFFIVNLAPAFLGVSLRCFAVTTFVGIMPATFVYALLGTGLGNALASGSGLEATLSPEIVAGLCGLGLLAALPALLRRLRRWRSDRNA